MKRWNMMVLVGIGVLVGTGARADVPLKTVRVTSGLEKPLQVTAPADDCNRIFIVEQGGQILIQDQADLGGQPSSVFLDISGLIAPADRIGHDRSEQGLLSMAFHPDYKANGFFYVHYIEGPPDGGTKVQIGDSVVSRFSVTADPDVADPGSELRILSVDNTTENHNGGMIAFSPLDNLLYISFGIMSGSGPEGLDLSILKGKLLRIDVNSDDFPADPDRYYSIPPGNPFAGVAGARDEIWAQGLRNPWRFSFDRENGDIYLGDVGGREREELNYQPGSSTGGENYGFNWYEGSLCLNAGPCDPTGLTEPIVERAHVPDVKEAIIGGYVYRGGRIPGLAGTYIYGDWWVEGSTSEPVADGMARFWSLEVVDGVATNVTERTAEFDPEGALTISNLASFGEDASGEIYICARADVGTQGQGLGEVYKIVAADDSESIALCVEPRFSRGDCNADGGVDVSDGIFNLIQLFSGGPAPGCAEACNANNDGALDLGDSVYLFTYLFASGPGLEPPSPECGQDLGQSLGCGHGTCL